MSMTEEQQEKLARAQEILGYEFKQEQLLLSAITHPSATEGRPVKYSYERLEFLGDSIVSAIVAAIAFDSFHEIDEGGLTRINLIRSLRQPELERRFLTKLVALGLEVTVDSNEGRE